MKMKNLGCLKYILNKLTSVDIFWLATDENQIGQASGYCRNSSEIN